MNGDMGKQNRRKFQRTLVLSCGALAAETAAKFRQQINKSDGPDAGVGLASLEAAASVTEATAILRQISQVTTRQALAERGWEMDRLDELALYLILDLSDLPEKLDLTLWLNKITEAAQKELGVATAALCLALTPTADDVERLALAALLEQRELFTRGVWLIGMTNAMGLRLPDAASLTGQTAAILQSLVATPLRDAPERLAERVDAQQITAPLVGSMGLSVWSWSLAAELDQLEKRWLTAVIAAWLSDCPAEESETISERWLLSANLELDQLLRRLGNGGEQSLVKAAPTAPQPWRVEQTYLPLCSLTEETSPAETAADLSAKGRALAQAVKADLQTTAAQTARERAVGGLSGLRSFAARLQNWFVQKEERALDLAEAATARAEAVAHQHNFLATELTGVLAQWPAPTGSAWLRLSLRPWQWFYAAWRYRQMGCLASQLTQLENEWRQWRRQVLLAEQAASIYQQIGDSLNRLDGQAEEVMEMLRYVQTYTNCPTSPPASYINRRLAQLIDKPELEAVWAAQAVGGLDRQLYALDDQLVIELAACGRQRLAAKGGLSAMATLATLHPDEDSLKEWQRGLWEMAAPLWRPGEREPGAAEQNSLTLVYGADALQLQQALPWFDGTHVVWVTGPDADISILRLETAAYEDDKATG
jgi:hypothetical protein